MEKLRIAVIGAGRLGAFHAQKLAARTDVRLTAIVDPVAANRNRLAAECHCPAVATCRDIPEQIHGAIIAAPTILHHRLAKELLTAGTNLLVEKPLCISAAEADELVLLARRHNRVLQVGHVERFNPAFSAIANRISRPKYIETTRTSGFTFRSTDVGAVLDIMIHDLDLVLALVNERIRKIDATGMKVVGKDEDMASVRIQFEGGCVANLFASRVSRQSVRQMRVWSEDAFTSVDFAARSLDLVRRSESLISGDFRLQELSPEQLEYQRKHFADEHLPCEQLQFDAVDALALEVQDFVQSIRDGREPLVNGEAGRDAVALAEEILDRIRAEWDSEKLSEKQPILPRRAVPLPHFSLSGEALSRLG
ncbi:MAG: Gfo/Idh/MocA family oxidoreductase [Thermoguttaceae bacterium]